MFRRLRKNPPTCFASQHKTYVQSKIDYGLSICGCTTDVNLTRVQWIQNLLASVICNNFDYIHLRSICLVRSLKLQTIRERRVHFPCVQCSDVFMASHRIFHVSNIYIYIYIIYIWVRSRNCGCLVAWFCYRLIAKPGNKTAAVSWPGSYVCVYNIYILYIYYIYIYHMGMIQCPRGSTNLRL